MSMWGFGLPVWSLELCLTVVFLFLLTKDQTWVPCNKVWSPNHWTTREFPVTLYFCTLSIYSFLIGSKSVEILVAVKLLANTFVFLGILKTFIFVFKWKTLKMFFSLLGKKNSEKAMVIMAFESLKRLRSVSNCSWLRLCQAPTPVPICHLLWTTWQSLAGSGSGSKKDLGLPFLCHQNARSGMLCAPGC